MSVRFSGSIGSLPFTALLIAGLASGAASARAQGAARPIEFSDPGSSQVVTNLPRFVPKTGPLRELESDPSKTFSEFDRSSLDAIPGPMVQPQANPMIQSARIRELLDKRKNWIFMSPDDYASTPTPESIFHLREYDANGQEKKKPSLFESFFERKQTNHEDRKSPKDKQSRDSDLDRDSDDSKDDAPRVADDNKLPTALRQLQQDLRKKLSETENSRRILDTAPPDNRLSDLLGMAAQGTLHNPMDRSKELNPQYHPFLGGPNAPGINSLTPFNPFSAAQDPNAFSAPVPAVEPLNGGLKLPSDSDNVAQNLTGPRLPDLNLKAVNDWNPMVSPTPVVENPRYIAPPISIPDFPRRKGI